VLYPRRQSTKVLELQRLSEGFLQANLYEEQSEVQRKETW